MSGLAVLNIMNAPQRGHLNSIYRASPLASSLWQCVQRISAKISMRLKILSCASRSCLICFLRSNQSKYRRKLCILLSQYVKPWCSAFSLHRWGRVNAPATVKNHFSLHVKTNRYCLHILHAANRIHCSFQLFFACCQLSANKGQPFGVIGSKVGNG
jgi:hypothetical protein